MRGASVGSHAAGSTDSGGICVVAEREDVAAALRAAKGGGTLFHVASMLSKGKGLCAAQFCTLLELIQSAFAGLLVLLGVHAKIVLWVAACGVCMIKRAVATVQNVDFGKGEVRVLVGILFAILRTYEFGPGRG